jgi:hypothetical protein
MPRSARPRVETECITPRKVQQEEDSAPPAMAEAATPPASSRLTGAPAAGSETQRLPFETELVKKSALYSLSKHEGFSRISSMQSSGLKHVERPNDRSGPRIEEGVSVRHNPAQRVFEQISGGLEGVTLRHVEQRADRSAPIIEHTVTIRRDVRPSLFAQIKQRLGFGPTETGLKRGWD